MVLRPPCPGAGGALACALLLAAPGSVSGEGREALRLCNPRGGIRAERVPPRGLRIRYLGESGRPAGPDFTLKGWQVRAAMPPRKGGAAPGGGRPRRRGVRRAGEGGGPAGNPPGQG